MPGRMGGTKRKIRKLKIVKIDTDLNVVMVKGAVPGLRWLPTKRGVRLVVPLATLLSKGGFFLGPREADADASWILENLLCSVAGRLHKSLPKKGLTL
ncbi:hypothetical protein Ancab_037295 [Ancistrocladus abbreviatus]